MRKFEYDDIPWSNKHTFLINSRRINTQSAYGETLRWMRHMAGKDGLDMELDDHNKFQGIRTMKVDVDEEEGGHELMALGIIYSGNKSLILVILRENLQILGFVVPELGRRLQLKSQDFSIEGFSDITGLSLSYGSCPLKSFGIGPMVKAFYGLTGTNTTPSIFAQSLEVFSTHFPEAARFKILEIQIARTMRISTLPFLPQRDFNDIRSLIEQKYETITDGFVVLPDFVRNVLANFDHLSSAWCIYVLSKKKYYAVDEVLDQKCRLGGPDTLQSILKLVKPSLESVKKLLGKMCTDDDHEMAEEILELLK